MASDAYLDDEPCYFISIAARMVSLHPQTLRYYERIGLVKPSRTRGQTRLYSQKDIERLRKITRLTDELGVNLAGVEVILNMTRRIEELQQELDRVQREAARQIEALERELARHMGEKEVTPADYEVLEATAVEREDMGHNASPEDQEGSR
ncbi:MAG: helix-turn-helix transcriptional regulator [Anaerolineae bacterium]|nr:helix-turn-helix transcriptional regulator [Anaerolineae bacterium]